jgi:cytochrome P450
MTQTPGENIRHCHKIAPGPRGNFLLGSPRKIQRDPLHFGLTMAHQYGDIVRMRFLLWPAYLVNHPDGINHVLQENQRNYSKDLYPYRIFQLLLGGGLVTNDGESWLQQRHLMQPAFHRKRMTAFGTLITSATVMMLDQWHGFAERDQPLDVVAEMLRLALHIAGQVLFRNDLSDEIDSICQAVTMVNKLLSEYLYAPFPPLGVPTQRNRRFQVARRTLDQIVQSIITHHRQQNTDMGDVLSMLLLARDEETEQGMNDQQIHDEVMTLLIAGHETVSTALAWTWYLLSQHPEVERRLSSELDEVLGGHVPTVDHLSRLSYTRMISQEVLRLYPEVSELRTRPGDERNISPLKPSKGNNVRSFFAYLGGSFPTSREFSRSCSEF